jgi:hypothetical protein
MSMHLEGPWLSTTGRRKGKKKWASAVQKQQAESLDAQWQQLKDKYAPKTRLQIGQSSYVPPKPLRRDSDQPRIASIDSGITGAVRIRAPMQYTGDKVKGIATMHKSNAVPVFTNEEAIDISKMRRG